MVDNGPSVKTVWIVIRDDGNAYVADECVDSVWSTQELAQAQRAKLTKLKPHPFLSRLERHKIDDAP